MTSSATPSDKSGLVSILSLIISIIALVASASAAAATWAQVQVAKEAIAESLFVSPGQLEIGNPLGTPQVILPGQFAATQETSDDQAHLYFGVTNLGKGDGVLTAVAFAQAGYPDQAAFDIACTDSPDASYETCILPHPIASGQTLWLQANVSAPALDTRQCSDDPRMQTFTVKIMDSAGLDTSVDTKIPTPIRGYAPCQ